MSHFLDMRDDRLFQLADFFRILGDPTRIKVIFQIRNQEICVSDIATCLNVSESVVSHHFQVLKRTGLVMRKRIGKSTFYSLADSHVQAILQQAVEHLVEMRK